MTNEPTDPIERARCHLRETTAPDLRDRECLEDVLCEYDRLSRMLRFHERTNDTPQSVEADRNNWQRRLGVLLTLIESTGDEYLISNAYRVVNTNPSSGAIDDPYADIATMKVRQVIEAAVEGGIVEPGPNAPSWLRTNDEEE